MMQRRKKTCSQKHLSHQSTIQGQNVCDTYIYYSICSQANRKDDKEEAVPCDDEESVLPHHQDQTPYPVVFQDALQERREMT